MRYGVLSDIHSNLEALDAALADLQSAGAEAWLVLGDTVGYGADPNAVIERVAGLPALSAVSGNHDLAVLGRMDLGWFNENAAKAVLWTRQALEPENRAWLEALPASKLLPDCSIVHGSPRNPAEEYLLTPSQFTENAKEIERSPCLVGHTHLPLYFQLEEGGKVVHKLAQGPGKLLLGGGPCVINPGSVGQPRDTDPRCAYGLYDSSKGWFEWRRAAYDVDRAQDKILKAGLPPFLSERLAVGR